MQKEDELALFVDELLELRPRRILEIGSFMGGTLYAWREVCDQVYCIDRRGAAAHGARWVGGDSHETLTRGMAAMLGPFDVLFVDGDHSYGGVRADVEMYAPLVRAGGVIALHDILRRGDAPDIEVWIYWRELSWPGKREIVTQPRTWGGIGVLPQR